MPALPDVPNVLRIRLLFSIGGKINQGLRFFMEWSGTAPTVAMLTTYANDIVTAFSGAGRPQAELNGENSLIGVTIEDLTSPTSAAAGVAASVVGSVAGTPLSADACVVQSYEIARRYRGGHPRSYWPLGSSADLLSNQSWAAASVTNFATAIDNFFAAIIGVTISGTTITKQVNVSYYEGFTSVENPITHRYRNVPTLRAAPVLDNINSYITQPYIGSQRRRRNKIS